MTDKIVATLFLPLTSGQIDLQRETKKILILNAYPGGGLMTLKPQHDVTLQSYYKPYVEKAKGAGFNVIQDVPSDFPKQDFVFICGSKNIRETQGLIANAMSMVTSEGYVVCAGANDEGASRYRTIFEKLGFTDVEEGSKNKARVVWGRVNDADQAQKDDFETQADWQNVLDDEFVSKPGIFGWDKEDKGSKLLLKSINEDINGNIADFGCGYGYLSVNLCQNYKNISKIYAVDADFRAIQASERNTRCFSKRISCHFKWEDLTKSFSVTDLDFVIMNPPFHEGKKTDTAIGLNFISTAHDTLKSGGVLWMVANAHLPYEEQIKKLFPSSQNVSEAEGYKIIRAVK